MRGAAMVGGVMLLMAGAAGAQDGVTTGETQAEAVQAAGMPAGTAAGQAPAMPQDGITGQSGGMRWSPLDQITPENVSGLEIAWTYRTGEPARRGEAFANSSFQDAPRVVAGSLIVCTPFNRIVALDPATGVERWAFDPEVDTTRPAPMDYKCRGVGVWQDSAAQDPQGLCATRLFVGTIDARLIALDARTGQVCGDFGEAGTVTLAPGKELAFNGEYRIISPPTVVGDVVAVGSAIMDNVRRDAPSGAVRAFNVRTGAPAWVFDPIPRDASDPAAATWLNGVDADVGHANVWSTMTGDTANDLLFLPTSSPAPDFWGGERPGDNRYGNSIVALRGSTGEVVWSFQFVHHDIWDYDTPSPPTLYTAMKDGSPVEAVAQTTKQGWVFLFERTTGKPLFDIEERPVPQDAVAGEWLSPTQPAPVAPPALGPQSMTPADAWGFTFADRWACENKIAALRHGPIYTPPSLEGTILMPGDAGGANWGGPAIDQQRRILVVNTNRVARIVKLIAREDEKTARVPDEGTAITPLVIGVEPQAGAEYAASREWLVSPIGAPCNAPPWGALSAIDLDKGEILWDVTLGSIEKMLPIEVNVELGTPNTGGPVVTGSGLVFIGATMDDKFRAFDLKDGTKLWETKLPAGGQSTPLTYEVDGRQYVVLAAGGHSWFGGTLGDHVIAWALPKR